MGFTKSTNFGNLWTEEEDEAVIAAFEYGGHKAVYEALPHRTPAALIFRIRKHGLGGRQKGHWTKDEDVRLRSLWGVDPIANIAKTLKRTPRAVYQRAVHTLGLEATCPEGWEHVTHAAERTGYSVDSLYRILKEANIKLQRAYSNTRERFWIVEKADVDFAVAARGETESLFGAATRRGMSADKLRARLAAIGITPPPRKPPNWQIARTDLQRVLSTSEYEGILARIAEVKARTNQTHIPMLSIERAGIETGELRECLAKIGVKEHVRKDIWRIRTEDIDRALEAESELKKLREPIKVAAKRVGVNAETLSKWLKKHGIVFKRRQPILVTEINRIVRLERPPVAHGEMVTDAAARLGVHYETLAKWLRKNGIPYKRGMRVPSADMDRIVKVMRYRPAGETLVEAARRHRVQPETLSKWLKRHGVTVQVGMPIPTPEIDRIVAIMRPPTENIVAVASRIGVHPCTIRIWLRAEGIEIRKGYAYRESTLLTGEAVEAIASRRRIATVAA